MQYSYLVPERIQNQNLNQDHQDSIDKGRNMISLIFFNVNMDDKSQSASAC